MGKTGSGEAGRDRTSPLPPKQGPARQGPPKQGASKQGPAKQEPTRGAPAKRTSTGGALTKGQEAYETRRAKEAGLTLDAWMARKARAAASAAAASPRPDAKKKGKGLLARLIDRAHRPI